VRSDRHLAFLHIADCQLPILDWPLNHGDVFIESVRFSIGNRQLAIGN